MTSKYGIVVVAIIAVALTQTAALAQENHGTAEQRAACTPDAFRLCSSYIPDAAGVEHCLRQNRSNLTAACRAVFDQNTVPQAIGSK